MTAALPARHGHADAFASRTVLEAHGKVAVLGSTPPRPRVEEAKPTLSPARQALADHIAHLQTLRAAADKAAKPADRLREQLSKATVDQQNAEHVLASIDAEHSARIARAAREGTLSEQPVESEQAEAAVSRARRHVASIKAALEECQADEVRANGLLEAAKTYFNRLALAVLVEQHHLALDRWAGARDEYYTAEAALRGLHQTLSVWGRELEDQVPGAGVPILQQLEKLREP